MAYREKRSNSSETTWVGRQQCYGLAWREELSSLALTLWIVCCVYFSSSGALGDFVCVLLSCMSFFYPRFFVTLFPSRSVLYSLSCSLFFPSSLASCYFTSLSSFVLEGEKTGAAHVPKFTHLSVLGAYQYSRPVRPFVLF